MVVKNQKVTEQYALYNGDCVEVLQTIPSESVGHCIHSPPFHSLYTYSDDKADMGNCKTKKEFFAQLDFLIEQLHRVMMPGRDVAVHCMELPTHKRDGEEIGIWDFPGEIVRRYIKRGFTYHARFCIWKDPLLAATRTKAIGLAHKALVKDSAICRTGLPDYVVVFRKPGENPNPISHPDGLTEYHGAREVPREFDKYKNFQGPQGKNRRSQWIWQQYASPVWFDIQQTKVLQFREARDNDDERHICPLQLQVIERCLALWATKGDVVLTPFMGVGSEVYVAVKNGCKAIGIELKESYYLQAVKNLRRLKTKTKFEKGLGIE